MGHRLADTAGLQKSGESCGDSAHTPEGKSVFAASEQSDRIWGATPRPMPTFYLNR